MITFTSNDNYSIKMSIDNEIDIDQLTEFFSCFAKAVGYSHVSVYKGFEKYLEEHEFEIRGNECAYEGLETTTNHLIILGCSTITLSRIRCTGSLKMYHYIMM